MDDFDMFWRNIEFIPEAEQVYMVHALMRLSPKIEASIANSTGFMNWLRKHHAAIKEWGDRESKGLL